MWSCVELQFLGSKHTAEFSRCKCMVSTYFFVFLMCPGLTNSKVKTSAQTITQEWNWEANDTVLRTMANLPLTQMRVEDISLYRFYYYKMPVPFSSDPSTECHQMLLYVIQLCKYQMNSISFGNFLCSSWKLLTGWTYVKTRACSPC